LADLERVGYLPKVWLAPQEVRELRRLVRFRQQLAKERRNIKLQLRAVLRDQRVKHPADMNPWTKAWLAWVETAEGISIETRWIIGRQLKRLAGICEEIVAVEKHLAEVTGDDPIVQKLLSYKGVGLITASTMRAEIGRFDRFRTGKQLARFCSLTPRNASSGQRQADAGVIKAGNPELRRVLIEAAHCLRRFDDRWHEFSERLKERGKPGNVIAAAVANRWVRGLFHEMVQIAA
jgi:transposase